MNFLPLSRDYEREREKISLSLQESSTSHPLLHNHSSSNSSTSKSNSPVVTLIDKTSNSSSSLFFDPLSPSLSSPSTFVDPLSSMLSNSASSPLSILPPAPPAEEPNLDAPESVPVYKSDENQYANLWKQKRNQIKKDFLITGSITLSSSNIISASSGNVAAGTSNFEEEISTKKVDKYTQRLAQLEKQQQSDSKNDKDKVELSLAEYEKHINKLSNSLDKAWSRDERVASLKIAIQLGKLLTDTHVPLFYPSMFVTVTEVLDKFGFLVFKRLVNKSEIALRGQYTPMNSPNIIITANKKVELNEFFTCEDIPQSAKDTTKNWFYKASCIRELVPRIYVEIALLKCYRLITLKEIPQIIHRIGCMIRGIGDPLVAYYARLYLIIKVSEMCTHLKPEYFDDLEKESKKANYMENPQLHPLVFNTALTMLQDSLFTFKMIHDPIHLSLLDAKKITIKSYFSLLVPPFDWILQTIAAGNLQNKNIGGNSNSITASGGKLEIFQSILELFREHSNDSLILKLIIDAFDSSYYCHATLGMISLIKSTQTTYFSQVDCFASLAKQLSIYPPPEEQRIQILNDVWKIVSKHNDLLSYVKCTAAWVDVLQKYYTEREMLILLGNLSGRVAPLNNLALVSSSSSQESSESSTVVNASSIQGLSQNDIENYDQIMREIEIFLTNLIGQSSTFGTTILTSEHLLKIIDVFRGTKKVQLCKEILDTFTSKSNVGDKKNHIRDPVLINTLFDLAKVVHDSIDSLSPVTDIGYTSSLLLKFISLVNFDRDFEQQLTFYVDCRAAFPNLEQIKDHLIMSTYLLIMNTFKYIKGKHTKKTSNFVKSCLAYCHITIPSLSSPFRRVQLLYRLAHAALVNHCLPQTDSFLKATISLLPELLYKSCEEDCDPELKNVTEDDLSNFITHLISLLAITPGHPSIGPFYLIQGLRNALDVEAILSHITKYIDSNGSEKTCLITSPLNLLKFQLNILSVLSVLGQSEFPKHIKPPNVPLNDELFAGDQNYSRELEELISSCSQDCLKILTFVGEKIPLAQKNSSLNGIEAIVDNLVLAQGALDFANTILSHYALRKNSIELVLKLVELSNKNIQEALKSNSNARNFKEKSKNIANYFNLTISFFYNHLKLLSEGDPDNYSKASAGVGIEGSSSFSLLTEEGSFLMQLADNVCKRIQPLVSK